MTEHLLFIIVDFLMLLNLDYQTLIRLLNILDITNRSKASFANELFEFEAAFEQNTAIWTDYTLLVL